MARKKKKIIQPSISEVDVQKKLELAREKRMKMAGITKKEIEENTRDEFRKYFIQVKRKLKIDSSLEKVIWLHLKASGFAKKELFDKGIEHFGYRL